jgi:hypothetical protein
MAWGFGVSARLSGRFRFVRLLSPILAVLLAACAQLPNQSSVQAFGQAASSVSTIFSNSVDLNADLAQRTGENNAVFEFLRDCPKDTSGNCGTWNYQLPTQDYAHLGKDALQPRRDLIAAIAKYAGALATASDPKTIQALQASATTLVSTVGGDVAPLLGGPAAVPLVAPIAQLIGTGVGLAVTGEQSQEIQEVMKRTHPALVQAASELKTSLAIIKHNNETQLRAWRTAQIAVLSKVRDDPRVPKTAAEAEFRAAASDAQTLQAKIMAMASFAQVLDAMVKAHASLINPGPDSSADLQQFLALVAQLQGVLSVIKH